VTIPAASLETVLAAVERLEHKLDALARPAPKLLSRRAAARVLGVDRGTTLAALIRDGHLHLVLGKVSQEELQRLIEQGLPEPKPRRRQRDSAEDPGSIRKAAI